MKQKWMQNVLLAPTSQPEGDICPFCVLTDTVSLLVLALLVSFAMVFSLLTENKVASQQKTVSPHCFKLEYFFIMSNRRV